MAVSAVTASPLAPRQNANAILSGLATVATDLKTLNGTVNKLTPLNPVNLFTALLIQTQANKINDDLNNLIKAAKAIPGQLNDDDSLNIAVAVGQLEGPIASTLNNIVVHKPYFATVVLGFGDLSKTVLTDLQTERSLIGKFGAALTPKISDTYQPLGPTLTAEVQALFDKAIAAYQKCSGLVCLPPITLAPPQPT